MDRDSFQAFEEECIRRAAGRPAAALQRISQNEGLRSRCYVLDGPGGGSFVKCLDAGFLRPAPAVLTLDHEAEGYRLFVGWGDSRTSVPQVHFVESFTGPDSKVLQVLGMTNVGAQGQARSLRSLFSDPGVSATHKETIVADHARALARLCSSQFQGSLDRAAGAAAVQRRTTQHVDHPQREALLADPGNHPAFPWAYENKIMGEMNVLLPMWLRRAETLMPERATGLRLVDRVLRARPLVDALSPGQSADRLIFSPGDRHDGNVLVVGDSPAEPMVEVDFELWGLETIGRLIGRYAAIQWLTLSEGWVHPERMQASESPPFLTGALLYNFVRGDDDEVADTVWRSVGVGVGSYYAALLMTHMAAVLPEPGAWPIDAALGFLRKPDRLLKSAADYGETRPNQEAEPVLETIGKVWIALQPLYDLTTSLLEDA